ncbi:type II secretion system protein GspC [Ahniella affigens]|uniref:Type II secretion system protein GspC n=1 Tax=Ahniella affigens TaxID=2021234 RepID=A0A2P1PW37_9GAMM|nr:type II secretion system protein GspC [Ahniella affigens]AVP99071.1 type II secretion system protein GspC [Ahniella affigens]
MWAKASEFFSESKEAVWLAQLGIAAAAAGMLWILLQLLWLGLGWSAPLPQAAILPTTSAVPQSSTTSLAAWHLFGNAKLLADPRAQAQLAPTTTLNVTLTGVLASSDPRAGVAFIAGGDGEPQKIRVGEEIQSGVMLDQVYPDRVILNRGGNLESLPLREDSGASSGNNTRSTGRATASNSTMPTPSQNTSFMAQVGQIQGPVGAPNIPAQGIDLEAVRKQYDVDPMALARAITPSPVMVNGEFVGVRLNAGPQQSMLQKLGLQPEDIVTSVNGQSITDPSRIQGIVAGLGNATSVSIQVLRNGKPQTLTLNVPR